MAALEASVKRAKAGRDAARASGSPPSEEETGSDLSEMSKDDLYEEAQRLDVPGRSKMSKDELAEAVAAAGSKKGRRAS